MDALIRTAKSLIEETRTNVSAQMEEAIAMYNEGARAYGDCIRQLEVCEARMKLVSVSFSIPVAELVAKHRSRRSS